LQLVSCVNHERAACPRNVATGFVIIISSLSLRTPIATRVAENGLSQRFVFRKKRKSRQTSCRKLGLTGFHAIDLLHGQFSGHGPVLDPFAGVTARIMPPISLISPKEKRQFSARATPRAFAAAFSFFGRVAVARCIARHRFRVTEYTVRYKFFISPKPSFPPRNSPV